MDQHIELEERVGLLSMGTDDTGEETVVDVLHDAPDAVLGDGAVDPVYEAKARVLNKAIQDIGMGRYQWQVRQSPASTNSHLDPLNGLFLTVF